VFAGDLRLFVRHHWALAARAISARGCEREASGTKMVHNGAMASKGAIRQSVTLPMKLAMSVRTMARRERTSANRMLVELLEEGIEARKKKEEAFYDLARRFRAATDPKEAERLGGELGRMVFGA